MTSAKKPVILTVFIECQTQRWYVGSINREGETQPLICSQPGNLEAYVGQEIDEQINFLRHRLAGVLQRGCDRLWVREEKPCQIVFVADSLFPHGAQDLTQRVADHFAEWMTSPAVAFFVRASQTTDDELGLQRLAGEIEESDLDAVQIGLPQLFEVCAHEDQWEVLPNKQPS